MIKYNNNTNSYDSTFIEEEFDPEEADEGFEKDLEEVLDPEDD
ncbi:MAG: hypothetical protein KR126chlam4_01384 [Candidatus Anoxychlamydiales bacterium]|uniref:Uncharacterized protein n=1 Tax=marine sediment metagenome TaxID=412755 RepID=A0A0F9CBK4_9ZZZZ|nr:hypothetical protein [Candidatus Anoxychlamydiales bacterium]NGX41543.1 hypothetical protein [Candidatus Anoxychlamydiales bacterium]